MPGPRDYTPRTLMALAHFSGGLCYWPGCPEVVLRDVNGEPHRIAEIAHIRGAYRNSARYDEKMTDDQRRDFSNLILLCDPHHDVVDAKEEIYTVAVLHRWKAQRESDPREAIKRLREVTPSGLRKIVAEGLEQRDAKLLNALGRLERSDREAATLIRSLVDELTEAYAQQALDPELVYSFNEATRTLTELEGTMERFISATNRLENYELSVASSGLWLAVMLESMPEQ